MRRPNCHRDRRAGERELRRRRRDWRGRPASRGHAAREPSALRFIPSRQGISIEPGSDLRQCGDPGFVLVPMEVDCYTTGQTVREDVVRAERDEDAIVTGVGGDGMRGAGGMCAGDRWHVKRRYQLKHAFVLCVDDAKDRRALSVGGPAYVERPQRAPGRGGVIVIVPRIEPDFVTDADATDRVDIAG